jgi:hypothetical protein
MRSASGLQHQQLDLAPVRPIAEKVSDRILR